jgi:hypothetical protein
MLAMQYSFTLPADYDMQIIRQRIADKGHLMDRFPHLAFKAFFYACRDGGAVKSRDNLYAPFYLWHHNEGLNAFLCGDGFAALMNSFGRPEVTLWSVWHAELSTSLSVATTATREIVPITPDQDLGKLPLFETEKTIEDVKSKGALAAIAAFEPVSWTLVRFRLWKDNYSKGLDPQYLQAFDVGYIALSDALHAHR